jgi:glycosyltransferase involved in cell wall biosynthesis
MVTTLHWNRYYLGWKSSLYKPAVSFSINKSDIVTSVSQSLKEDTYKLFNIKDIHVIPNFIELDKNIQDPFHVAVLL